jgi:hypothetical protein
MTCRRLSTKSSIFSGCRVSRKLVAIQIYRELAAEASHQGLNLVEQICAVPGNEAAPEVLGMLPQDLNPIELRTVGRQIVQIQPVFGPLAPLLLHQVTLVNACIVDQDDAGTE